MISTEIKALLLAHPISKALVRVKGQPQGMPDVVALRSWFPGFETYLETLKTLSESPVALKKLVGLDFTLQVFFINLTFKFLI